MRKAIVEFCNEVFAVLMAVVLVFVIMHLTTTPTPPKDYPPDTTFNTYQPVGPFNELYAI
jgi:hypothetical protein